MTHRLLALAAILLFSAHLSAAPGQLGAESALNADAIKARIAPVGGVCVQGEECKPVGLAAQPVAGAATTARSGEQVFNSVCSACHATGAAGAPKVGDKAAWAPRLAQGEPTLLQNALAGIRGMPPRGGCASCLDEEIASAVKHMADQSR